MSRLGQGGGRPRLAALALILAALVSLVTASHGRAASFPALTGRVVDNAHVLPPEAQETLTAKLKALELKTSRQLVVVTLPSLEGQEIADYGYQLLRAWGVGQKATNNGALFIIVPSEHKVRIEAGYGVEGVLTDAVSSQILQEKVLPRFRANDIPGGVEAGTDALIDQLSLDPSAAEQKAAEAETARAQSYRHGPSSRPVSVFGLIIPLLFFFFVVSRVFRGGRGGGFLPGLVIGGLMGGWGGGGRDDDFGGGGGGSDDFSGGGGSSGGGGASGSW